MATYQVVTNAALETVLDWVLARQQAANPDTAPADKAALVTALFRDRMREAQRQHQRATASTPTALKQAIDTATPEELERIAALLLEDESSP